MKTIVLSVEVNIPNLHLSGDGTIPMKIKENISSEIKSRLDTGVIIGDKKLESGYNLLDIKEKGEE